MDQALIFKYLKRTRVIKAPGSTLATFGATHIEYHLISAIDGLEDKTRLRQGEVVSQKPQILTPQALVERFEGFGPESKEFADWLGSSYGNFLRTLEYQFQNKGFATQVISESPQAVIDRIKADIENRNLPHQAIISCPDAAWPLALMKFTLDESARSFPVHLRDMERRGMFDPVKSQEDRQKREIEKLFEKAASGDKDALELLGTKLKESGLFTEYEDRYLSFF